MSYKFEKREGIKTILDRRAVFSKIHACPVLHSILARKSVYDICTKGLVSVEIDNISMVERN
ncbi:hypothetical protein [Bacillus sp. OTU530]|uniref:hypothetical protein n=1 Tax=Bacillus sp. OTU530 TaxID=3043862 RepID=UPI00313F3A7C